MKHSNCLESVLSAMINVITKKRIAWATGCIARTAIIIFMNISCAGPLGRKRNIHRAI